MTSPNPIGEGAREIAEAIASFNASPPVDDFYGQQVPQRARLPILATDCDYEIVSVSGVQGKRIGPAAAMMRDVDPQVVAQGNRDRVAYREKTAAWGNPMRCQTQVCDQDGSCVACGAVQGENCRSLLASTQVTK